MINIKHCRGCALLDPETVCMFRNSKMVESVAVPVGQTPGHSINHKLRPECYQRDGIQYMPVSLIARLRRRNAAK